MPGPSGPESLSQQAVASCSDTDLRHTGNLRGVLRTFRRMRGKQTGSGECLTRWILRGLPCYGAQAGSPSPAVLTTGFVVLTAIPQEVFASCVWLFVALQ